MKFRRSVFVSLLVFLASSLLPAAAQTAAGPTEEEVQKITAAAPDQPTAPPLRPRKLLLFNRNEGFPHTAIPYGAKAVEILGQKTGAFEVVVSDDLGIFTPEKLEPFDAILFNNGYGFTLDEPARQALRDFVQGGKGLVGIHAASANFEGWPEGTPLFGAKFASHPWVPSEEWAIKNEDPDHPLNAAFGGQGFRVQEEIYTFTDFRRERVHVLLSLDLQDPRTGQVPHPDPFVPISWVHRLGEGRVFFCSLGHVHDLFWTPAVLRHYLDGIQFALGDLKADDTPDRAWPFAVLKDDQTGETRQPLEAIAEQVQEAGQDPARLAHLEQQTLQVLRSDAALEVKRSLCQILSPIATAASVPVVSPLLSDPELSHLARTVLERVGGSEAAAALRAALPDVSGRLKAGVIGSLGHLRDREAAALLAPLVDDPDPAVAAAAISALGRISGSESAKALTSAKVPDLKCGRGARKPHDDGPGEIFGKIFEGEEEILGGCRIHSQSTLTTQFSSG
jgi:type 1 glutamine amidotransferase